MQNDTQPEKAQKPRKKPGGQPGNRSNLRHALTTGKLPFKGGHTINRYRNAFRLALEDELLRQRREIGVAEAATIAAAVTWYTHAMKARRWLGEEFENMTLDQRLAFSREEATAMAKVSRLLKTIGIERPTQSNGGLWETIYMDAPSRVVAPSGITKPRTNGATNGDTKN